MEIKFGSSNSGQITNFYLIDGDKNRQVYYDANDYKSLINILKDIRNMPKDDFDDIIDTIRFY